MAAPGLPASLQWQARYKASWTVSIPPDTPLQQRQAAVDAALEAQGLRAVNASAQSLVRRMVQVVPKAAQLALVVCSGRSATMRQQNESALCTVELLATAHDLIQQSLQGEISGFHFDRNWFGRPMVVAHERSGHIRQKQMWSLQGREQMLAP